MTHWFIRESSVSLYFKTFKILIDMEREILMERTIFKMERLPTKYIQEVNDFVEFIIQRTNDKLITEGLQQLSSAGNSFDFLKDDPELYTVDDLKVRFV